MCWRIITEPVVTQPCNRVIRFSRIAGFQPVRRITLVYSPKHIVFDPFQLLPTLPGDEFHTSEYVRAIIVLPVVGVIEIVYRNSLAIQVQVGAHAFRSVGEGFAALSRA